MVLAEQSSAFPAVDVAIDGSKPLPTCRLGTDVVVSRLLPMCSGHHLVGVWSRFRGSCPIAGDHDRWECRSRYIVGLEDVQALELLVDDSQRLKPLRLYNLLVEPVLDLILLDFGELLMIIVEVSVSCQLCGLCTHMSLVPIQLQ
jgi:hypothetical protein